MYILKVITIVLMLFTLALFIEKLLHITFSLKEVVYQLKKDAKTLLSALFTEEKVRHIFESKFADELRNVARPYANPAFDIDVGSYFNSGTLFIGVAFVPAKKMDLEELNEVTNLLLLKFRRYLLVHNLDWKTFACFSSGNDFVNVYLYYAEMPEDIENFKHRYRMTVKEKVAPDYGILQDEELNKELDSIA